MLIYRWGIIKYLCHFIPFGLTASQTTQSKILYLCSSIRDVTFHISGIKPQVLLRTDTDWAFFD